MENTPNIEGIKHSVALYKIYSILYVCSKFYLFIFSVFFPYFCRQHTMSKLSRAIKFIMAIWIVAFCLAIPQAIQFGIVTLYGGRSCTVSLILLLGIILLILFFLKKINQWWCSVYFFIYYPFSILTFINVLDCYFRGLRSF